MAEQFQPGESLRDDDGNVFVFECRYASPYGEACQVRDSANRLVSRTCANLKTEQEYKDFLVERVMTS